MHYYFIGKMYDGTEVEFSRGLWMCQGESYYDDFDKLYMEIQAETFREVLLKSRWSIRDCHTIVATNGFPEDDITFNTRTHIISYASDQDVDELDFDFCLDGGNQVFPLPPSFKLKNAPDLDDEQAPEYPLSQKHLF